MAHVDVTNNIRYLWNCNRFLPVAYNYSGMLHFLILLFYSVLWTHLYNKHHRQNCSIRRRTYRIRILYLQLNVQLMIDTLVNHVYNNMLSLNHRNHDIWAFDWRLRGDLINDFRYRYIYVKTFKSYIVVAVLQIYLYWTI